MSYLTVESREVNGTRILYLNGYLNSLLGEEVARMVGAVLDAGGERVLLNFEGTRLINSIGISFIIGAVERMAARNGTLAFCSLSPINRELFRITGVARDVRSFRTEDEALAWLGRRA
ncbi:MAG: STAS domain-containing protein [Gemmatimonadota bacterium]